MTAVYIHFPWCLHRCAYCDFATIAARQIPRERYTRAILSELELRIADTTLTPIESIFFGGGTPSLWGPSHVAEVLGWLAARVGLSGDAEITLEANPGTVESGDLAAYAAVGVTRISVGIQALDDRRLQRLDRLHDTQAALATLATLRDLLDRGVLQSASADLILGSVGQGQAELRADIALLLTFELPHVSVYALTVEPGTPLFAQVQRGMAHAPDDDLQATMLAALPGLLRPAGLEPYEVSNFARPGHECRHNLAYWTGQHYLSAGVGAHGFAAFSGAIGRRYGNHRSHALYFGAVEAGQAPEAFGEVIDARMHMDERLLTGLRLRDGVDLGAWRSWAGDQVCDAVLRQARSMADRGEPVVVRGERIALTEAGMLAVDWVVLALASAGERAAAAPS